jgi:hypothetical protein
MRLLALFLLAAGLQAAEAPRLNDDFVSADHPVRRAQRGPWQFAEGVATCTQDDALYKKFKDHGPILFYDFAHQDAVVRFAYRADPAVKTVVFTANGADGHVFRFVTSARGTSVRAFPPGATQKSIAVGQAGPALKTGTWVPVEVRLQGAKATVHIGSDFVQTFEHPSFARAKTNLSLGFSFGTLAVRDWVAEGMRGKE